MTLTFSGHTHCRKEHLLQSRSRWGICEDGPKALTIKDMSRPRAVESQPFRATINFGRSKLPGRFQSVLLPF